MSARLRLSKLNTLIALIRELSYEQREVTLASGLKSDFYFDGKQTSLHPEGASLIGEFFFDLIKKNYPEAQAVGGPTLGADPLVTAVSLFAFAQQKSLPAFIIRKEPKGHGTNQWIEGAKNLKDGMRVVLLEDVVTTGASLIKSAKPVREAGYQILGCVVLVDRQEGGREKMLAEGLPLTALFTKKEILG